MSDKGFPDGFFSARVGRITVSQSNAGAQRVRELRAQGHDIIGLTITLLPHVYRLTDRGTYGSPASASAARLPR